MTALGDALIEAWSGAGRVVFIVGEAGIGKTRLVETLADEACARGGRALVARGWESEQALPFQLWIDLVREGRSSPSATSWSASAWRDGPNWRVSSPS
jgi:predicted ATPase